MTAVPRIGLLALQGAVQPHRAKLLRLGAEAPLVRNAEELAACQGLILPGGESTTIAKGLDRLGLWAPIEAFAQSGRALLGTCAGAVLLARRDVEGGSVPGPDWIK